MKRIITNNTKNIQFGKRLTEIRKAKGITQKELAEALGISQRMVAYYEGQSEFPPATIIPDIAIFLKVSTDQLLGLKPITDIPSNGKLFKKLKLIENFNEEQKKTVISVIETIAKTANAK